LLGYLGVCDGKTGNVVETRGLRKEREREETLDKQMLKNEKPSVKSVSAEGDSAVICEEVVDGQDLLDLFCEPSFL